MLTVANILETKGNKIYSVSPGISVFEALKVMGEKNIGALMVLENGELKGIFSERDYARKIVLKNKASKDTLVKEIMTETVITVTPADSIENCMSIMTGNKIRHLPVIDNGNIAGIISIGDVVNAIIRAQNETISHLRSYIGQ